MQQKIDNNNVVDAWFLIKSRKRDITPIDNSLQFQYFYSENYQSVDKLVSSVGKNQYLSDDDFKGDFLDMYKDVGDNEMYLLTLKNYELGGGLKQGGFSKITGDGSVGFRKKRAYNEYRKKM